MNKRKIIIIGCAPMGIGSFLKTVIENNLNVEIENPNDAFKNEALGTFNREPIFIPALEDPIKILNSKMDHSSLLEKPLGKFIGKPLRNFKKR